MILISAFFLSACHLTQKKEAKKEETSERRIAQSTISRDCIEMLKVLQDKILTESVDILEKSLKNLSIRRHNVFVLHRPGTSTLPTTNTIRDKKEHLYNVPYHRLIDAHLKYQNELIDFYIKYRRQQRELENKIKIYISTLESFTKKCNIK